MRLSQNADSIRKADCSLPPLLVIALPEGSLKIVEPSPVHLAGQRKDCPNWRTYQLTQILALQRQLTLRKSLSQGEVDSGKRIKNSSIEIEKNTAGIVISHFGRRQACSMRAPRAKERDTYLRDSA